jgi:hypothetical protein
LIKGASKKARREVVTKQKLKHEDYEAGVIPTEWEGKLFSNDKLFACINHLTQQ